MIENNPITTIFQNDERPRNGKFNQPQKADNMVKHLLNSWDNLKKLKYQLIIVPVCINYDRIFDSKYFQEDVMKGIFKPGTTLFDIMHMIYSMR